MLDLYDVIVSRPPDSIIRKNPVPNFSNITKIFKDCMVDVTTLTDQLVSSGLWDRGIQLPKSSRFTDSVEDNY
jgi:hypothetical protein